MEGPTGFSLIPSGTFQPDTPEDENHDRDFTVTRTVLREFAEELLEVNEAQEPIRASRNFLNDPRLKPYLDGRENGAVRAHYLGLSVDPVLAKPDLMIALVIDATQFPDSALSIIENWKGNWEGHMHEVPLQNLMQWSKEETLAATGATCLQLAHKHLKFLLQDVC
jgi:hypothetical protein